METTKPECVEKDQIVLSRRDILRRLRQHRETFASLLSDANLMLETVNAVRKTEHTDLLVSYAQTISVADDLCHYLEDCWTLGVQGTIKERTEQTETKGGD